MVNVIFFYEIDVFDFSVYHNDNINCLMLDLSVKFSHFSGKTANNCMAYRLSDNK